MTTFQIDPSTQHIVTVTPGIPLILGDREYHRAVAECSRCGVIAAGMSQTVIEVACTHA